MVATRSQMPRSALGGASGGSFKKNAGRESGARLPVPTRVDSRFPLSGDSCSFHVRALHGQLPMLGSLRSVFKVQGEYDPPWRACLCKRPCFVPALN